MIFNINFLQWKNQLLPPRLVGKVRFSDLLDSMLSSVSVLHSTFLDFRREILFKLWFTGQVLYLEKVLNSKFNNDLPAYTVYPTSPSGIYIVDAELYVQKYRWNIIEGRVDIVRWTLTEVTSDPSRISYRRTLAEINNTLDFTVMIPNAVGSISDPLFVSSIKAWINYYRQAGSRFTLQNY